MTDSTEGPTPDAPECIGSDMPPPLREGCLHGFKWTSECPECKELSMSPGDRKIRDLERRLLKLQEINVGLVKDFNTLLVDGAKKDTELAAERARADKWEEKFQAECKRSDEYMNADFQSRGKLAAAEARADALAVELKGAEDAGVLLSGAATAASQAAVAAEARADLHMKRAGEYGASLESACEALAAQSLSLEAAERALEEAQRDAQRYRWLRMQSGKRGHTSIVQWEPGNKDRDGRALRAEELDAYVDDALAARRQG